MKLFDAILDWRNKLSDFDPYGNDPLLVTDTDKASLILVYSILRVRTYLLLLDFLMDWLDSPK